MNTPLRIALVNDYDIVLAGLRELLAPYGDRVRLAAPRDGAPLDEQVDVALYDSHGRGLPPWPLHEPRPQGTRRVLYTWDQAPGLASQAIAAGADGVLSKTLPAAELVDALERVAAGQVVVAEHRPAPVVPGVLPASGPDWPGRRAGLTMREAEMVTLIAQGLSNAEIAEQTFLSPNSVKSYIRSAYRKIGVRRRSQAVAWGIDNQLAPQRTRQLP